MKGKKNTKSLVGKKEVKKVVDKKKKEERKLFTIEDAIVGIEKEFKDINPDIVSDPKRIVQFISSGNFVFNIIANQFTVGGFPRRRISEVFGMEHCGKSSIIYKAFADLQKSGGIGVLLDYEGSWEPQYAKRTFGLIEDRKTFVVFQPDTVEEGDKVFEFLQKLYKIDLLVIDSVDAMKPQALIECSLDKEARVGAHATAVGKVVAKFRRFARFKDCAIVFTNQIRSTISKKGMQNQGVGAGFNVMENYTTPGGWALRFYASLRMKVEFSGQIKDKFGVNAIGGEKEEYGIRIGNQIKIINVKNKVGPPMLKYVTHFIFPTKKNKGGWDEALDIMYILKKRGRLRQVKGKLIYYGLKVKEWSYDGSKMECDEAFKSNKELVEDGKKLVLELMGTDDILETVEAGDIKFEDVEYQDSLHPSVKLNIEEEESVEGEFESGGSTSHRIKNVTL